MSPATTGPRKWPEPVHRRGWGEACVSACQTAGPGTCLRDAPQSPGDRAHRQQQPALPGDTAGPRDCSGSDTRPAQRPQDGWARRRLGLPPRSAPWSFGPRGFQCVRPSLRTLGERRGPHWDLK